MNQIIVSIVSILAYQLSFKCHLSTIFQLYIDLWATFPGTNMVQGRNTLGYLRTRTFYIPERKYGKKKIWSQNVWHVHLEKCKKKSLNIHSHVRPRCPTKYSDLESVDSKICRTFLWSESNILGRICATWEYDRWYTWSVLYYCIIFLSNFSESQRWY